MNNPRPGPRKNVPLDLLSRLELALHYDLDPNADEELSSLLSRRYLGKADLHEINFNSLLIEGTSFFRANLRGANFSWAKAVNCSFDGADLSHADLFAFECVGCVFWGADLTCAHINWQCPELCSAVASYALVYRPGIDANQDDVALAARFARWCCNLNKPAVTPTVLCTFDDEQKHRLLEALAPWDPR